MPANLPGLLPANSTSIKVMQKFLSCDWGTSSFRLRLVEIASAGIVAQENSNNGIAKVFEQWKQCGKPEEQRFLFYLHIIVQHVDALEKKLNSSLNGVPLVISGMACSSLGMIDLPYKELPFHTDGSDLVTKIVRTYDTFKHDIIFTSGAKSGNDAMRGEETQVVGCLPDDRECVFIFPGTHSKHVTVKNKNVVDIKTYMTGEFFELLSEKSILSSSVEKNVSLDDEKNKKAFEAGVKESLHSNLLNSSFKVRTNYLFRKLTQPENYHFLSGLLIGTEVKEVSANGHDIILVSNSLFWSRYETAFNLIVNNTRRLKIQDADEVIVAGQLKILNRLIN
jgi:2-dehydro-3-deoxygalactonokinase